jgi:predicted nucleic acid-binding protein
MTAYLLDTSAALAHAYQEPGYERVQALFHDGTAVLMLAAPSLLEMETSLTTRIRDDAQREALTEHYGGLLAQVVPVDRTAVLAAIALRNAATKRLPAVDAMIAGCAAANDAILVHRDPHFDAIPASRLKTLRLPDTEDPPTSADVPLMVKETQTKYNVAKRRRKNRP